MATPEPLASVADVERLVATARRLLQSGGALQSTAGGERIDGTDIVRALAPGDRIGGDARATIAERSAATAVVRTAEVALRKAVGREGAAALSDAEVSNLQAIVHVLGRPATMYVDGRVQMPPDLGQNDLWRTLVATQRQEIDAASAAVGQIARGTEVLGTLWRLGDDLAVTNRHVIELIVRDASRAPGEWELDPALTVTADFNVTRQPTKVRRFGVTAVRYCADDDVDFGVVALARGADPLPAPPDLDFSPAALGRTLPTGDGGTTFKGESVYVVGHPFRLVASQASATVFGQADGSKRWSPGLVTAVGETSRTLEHDCSTLGGNSGGCVFEPQEHAVVALHVGGRGVEERTGRGVSNVAVAFSRLGGHRAETILRAGRV